MFLQTFPYILYIYKEIEITNLKYTFIYAIKKKRKNKEVITVKSLSKETRMFIFKKTI